MVDRHANELGEHFDHVQILASWEDDAKRTLDIFSGKGNFYARIGMAREFLVRDISRTNAHEIKNELQPDEE